MGSVMGVYDAVLLVGFGGPDRPGEAVRFIRGVLGERPGVEGRVAEVAARYEAIGGASPFNRLTGEQAHALELALRRRGPGVPVRVALRHWEPRAETVLRGLAAEGRRRVLAVVLAPYQSAVTWDAYLDAVRQVQDGLLVDFLPPWWDGPGFTGALADRVRETGAPLGERAIGDCAAGNDPRTALVFTAHALPMAQAVASPYRRQFEATARAVAGRLGREAFHLAYQSLPASAVEVTGPDILDLLPRLVSLGHRSVVVVPAGFLCDHLEVLYDLDVAARTRAEELGLGWHRAATVGSHPLFIGMLADQVADRLR
ncbi:MAG: ferrochelatase [Planctomycetes bacterium]|nr:ferrochelatase [Planctomycetota bacterium]